MLPFGQQGPQEQRALGLAQQVGRQLCLSPNQRCHKKRAAALLYHFQIAKCLQRKNNSWTLLHFGDSKMRKKIKCLTWCKLHQTNVFHLILSKRKQSLQTKLPMLPSGKIKNRRMFVTGRISPRDSVCNVWYVVPIDSTTPLWIRVRVATPPGRQRVFGHMSSDKKLSDLLYIEIILPRYTGIFFKDPKKWTNEYHGMSFLGFEAVAHMETLEDETSPMARCLGRNLSPLKIVKPRKWESTKVLVFPKASGGYSRSSVFC